VALEGDSEVIDGGGRGALIVNVTGADEPAVQPEALGLVTWIEAVPAVAIRLAGTRAPSDVAPLKVVGSGVSFHRTTD
jgi:hypothetical protein